jgi:hypothetical protein
MGIAESIYLLCAFTSLGAATLLLRYFLRHRSRLLFWSCICFAGLAINNVLVYIDLALLPTTIDLSVWRSLAGAVAMCVLAYALVSESTR